MGGCVRGALVLALAIVMAAVGAAHPAAAQKPPPGAVPPLAVGFDVTLTLREVGRAETELARLSGRVNRTGEVEARVDVTDLGLAIEAIVVGERLYLRIGGGGWSYLDVTELSSLAGPGPAGGARGAPGAQVDAPACMAILTELAGRLQDPTGLLHDLGSFRAAGPNAIDGVPVTHYMGTVDLRRLAGLFGPLLDDPACTGDEALSLAALVEEAIREDLPPIRYDVYLGQADQFPYRFRIVIGLEDGEFEVAVDLRPSPSFFNIRAPVGATPLMLPIPPVLPARSATRMEGDVRCRAERI